MSISQRWSLDTGERIQFFVQHVTEMMTAGRPATVAFIKGDEPERKGRTLTQNRALHLFLGHLAEALNDSGFDMVAVLNDGVSIPWSTESAKEHLWKPIQKAMLNKESTTEANTTDYSAVYEVLTRHLGSKLGIQCPAWPSRFTQGEEA